MNSNKIIANGSSLSVTCNLMYVVEERGWYKQTVKQAVKIQTLEIKQGLPEYSNIFVLFTLRSQFLSLASVTLHCSSWFTSLLLAPFILCLVLKTL